MTYRPHRESKWQVVVDFVNDHPAFTTHEYYRHCAERFVCKKTAENYRVFLTGAGYLAKVERLWRRLKRVPKCAVAEVFREAYHRNFYNTKETHEKDTRATAEGADRGQCGAAQGEAAHGRSGELAAQGDPGQPDHR